MTAPSDTNELDIDTVAPVHVEEFLKYVNVPYDPLDENPLPGYGCSTFTKFDQSTGLL